MNIPSGPWLIDDLLTFTVTTHRFDTGALTDADAVPSYRVYEDEAGTAILTGSMAKLDDTNTTGFYSEQITLSAANGFEAGKSYSIYVTAAVNSVTGGQSGGFKVVGAMPANVTQFGGTNGTFSGGRPEVNTTHAAGTAWNSACISSSTFANNAITSAVMSSAARDAISANVWAASGRTLTAGTNIVLAKGTGVTGLNDLDAAGVRSAVGLASANLDTQIGTLATASNLATVAGYIDTEVAAIKAVTDKLDTAMELDGAEYRFTANALEQAPGGGSAPTADEIRDAIFARVYAASAGGLTFDELTSLMAYAMLGKVSGMDAGAPVFRNLADSADGISATTDQYGNRTAVTLAP